MTRPILLIVASAMLVVATPIAAIASDPASEPASGTQPAPAKAESKTRYCVIETPLGSHLSKKTCLTREEWLKQGVDPLAK